MLIAESDYDLTEREFQLVSDLVYRHCGINLHDGKKELVRARMAKHIRSGGFRSVAAYLEHVNNEPVFFRNNQGSGLVMLVDICTGK